MSSIAAVSPVRRYALIAALFVLLVAVAGLQRFPPRPTPVALPDPKGSIPIVNDPNARYHLDAVSAGGAVVNIVDVPTPHIEIHGGQPLSVLGWAVDARKAQLAAGVAAVIDDRLRIAGIYGDPRSDVAQALHDDAFIRSGFRIAVPAAALSIGKHTLALFILSADRATYYSAGASLTIDVTP